MERANEKVVVMDSGKQQKAKEVQQIAKDLGSLVACIKIILALFMLLILGVTSKNKIVRYLSACGLVALVILILWLILQPKLTSTSKTYRPVESSPSASIVHTPVETPPRSTESRQSNQASQIPQKKPAPKKSADRYLKMDDDALIEESASIIGDASTTAISPIRRNSIANLLVFRDTLRSLGVPDESFKKSLASGGIVAENLAAGIDSCDDIAPLVSALETCLEHAEAPDWMRWELKIRVCYHHILHDAEDRSRDIILASKGGESAAQAEVLVLEAMEILRVIVSPGMKLTELVALGNKDGKPLTSSNDFAKKLYQSGKYRGIAVQWLLEIRKWGIAWNPPPDVPEFFPLLLSPGFPCKQIAADPSRVEDIFRLDHPAAIVCYDGTIRNSAAGELSWQFIYDREDFREALDLVYLTPNGVVKPLLSKHRDEARKFDWPGKCHRECGQAFEIVQKGFAEFGGVELAQAPVPDVAFVGDKQYDIPLQKAYRHFKSADLMFRHGMLVAWRLKAHFDASASSGVLQNEISALTQDVGVRLERMNNSRVGIHCNLSYSLPWELSFNKANLTHVEMRTAIQGRVRTNFILDETDEGYDLFMIVDARLGMLRLIERTLSMAGIPAEDFDFEMSQPIWGSEAW